MPSTTNSTPEPQDLDTYLKALELGQSLISSGKTKVEATRAMYPLIKDESRDVICQAFVNGADLTERGAMTYFYNAVRHFRKQSPST